MSKTVHFVDDDPRGGLFASLETTAQSLNYLFVLHKGREAITSCLKKIKLENKDNYHNHSLLIDIAIPLAPASALYFGLTVEPNGLNGLSLADKLISLDFPTENIALISNLTDIGAKEANDRGLAFFSKHDLNLLQLKSWLKK